TRARRRILRRPTASATSFPRKAFSSRTARTARPGRSRDERRFPSSRKSRSDCPGSLPAISTKIPDRAMRVRDDGANVMTERLYLFDTTLRDGQQTAGVDFALEEKLTIARLLAEIGVDYIEGGFPGANPTDTALFSEARTFGNATFTAFGMTKRPGRSVSNDAGLQAVLTSKADALCFVGKSWDYHVDIALGTTLDENLGAIRETVKAGAASDRETMIDCEHFF